MKVTSECIAWSQCWRKRWELLQRSRNVLLEVCNIPDKTNHRLYLNPTAHFEFGINAAIIRPENIEPSLIKCNYSKLRLNKITVRYRNMWPFTEGLFQLVVAWCGVKLIVTVLCIWVHCSGRDHVTACGYTNKLRRSSRNRCCGILGYYTTIATPKKLRITYEECLRYTERR